MLVAIPGRLLAFVAERRGNEDLIGFGKKWTVNSAFQQSGEYIVFHTLWCFEKLKKYNLVVVTSL